LLVVLFFTYYMSLSIGNKLLNQQKIGIGYFPFKYYILPLDSAKGKGWSPNSLVEMILLVHKDGRYVGQISVGRKTRGPCDGDARPFTRVLRTYFLDEHLWREFKLVLKSVIFYFAERLVKNISGC